MQLSTMQTPHIACLTPVPLHDPPCGTQVRSLSIPCSEAFDFSLFLADPSNVRDWNIQGLPADAFSTENGVMVTRGRR